MAIPNPNPNIADGVKCDNKTYSSNKIESLIKVATELPVPEAGDAGKVLTVNSDADGYELDVIPNELPTPESGDAGKVLAVNAGETGYELEALAAVAASGSYNDLEDTPTIPTVPTLTAIDKDDFFVDASNVGDFIAYEYGNIVIVMRCVISGVTYTIGDNEIIKIKDAYCPADGAGCRICLDDGSSSTPFRAFIDGTSKNIKYNTISSSSTAAYLYAFSYVKV